MASPLTLSPSLREASDDAPNVLLVGGADVDARLELMRCLAPHWRVGAVGASPYLAETFAAAGFAYYHYPLQPTIAPLADLRSKRSLERIFREVRPQVVHTFDMKPGILARWAACKAGVPVVVGTITGLGALYVDDSPAMRVLRLFYEMAQRRVSRLASMTIFQNHDDYGQLVNAGIVPRERASVVLGSGVSTTRIAPDAFDRAERRRLRGGLGLDETHLVLTFISRVMRSKGVLELAEAAAVVRERHPHVRVLLVGPHDPGGRDSLTEAEMGRVQAQAMCLGKRRDIPALLACSDIFVLPTFYREGIPRVALEAAAMGLPLVVTDVPGCREAVRHGDNGLLVPPRDARALADAILILVEDASLRQAFGARSRERAVQEFDITLVAEQISTIYRRCLASQRAPAAV